MTLENGLNVALAPRDTKNFAAQLRIYHGAAHERLEEEGLAHFLEHIIWGVGGEGITQDEANYLRTSAGYSNAVTNMATTTYQFSDMGDRLDDALRLFKGSVFRPHVDAKVLEQERKRVLRELADIRHDANYQGGKILLQLTKNQEDPCRNRDVGGKKEIVASANRDQLLHFHERGYGARNALLVIAGAIPSNIEDIINNKFSDLPSGLGAPYIFPNPQFPTKPEWHELETGQAASKAPTEESSAALDLFLSAPALKMIDDFQLISLILY